MVFEKSLTAMIKGLRANASREQDFIQECLAEIRKELQTSVSPTKANAVQKLTYLHMMGYDMQWASFQIVEVMSDNRFWMKRAAYLAAQISFNERTDVALLCINLLKKDFSAPREVETGVALNALATIATPDMARDLVADVLTMLSSSRPYLRKKAVLCLFRLFVRHPKALVEAFPKIKDRLADEDQGVLNATVNTLLELARKNAKNYLPLAPHLFHVLTNTTDNWLIIKLLKLFQLLCQLEERLKGKLVEPVHQIVTTTKAKSVEFEAVRLVVRCLPDVNAALTAACVERLKNFCNASDRNLRYLGLLVFDEALATPMKEAAMKDMSGRIAESVEEVDPTLRRTALRILHQMVEPDTFPEIAKKLMEMKSHGSSEFAQTVLAMGARDQFRLVEDFGWYLIVLTEIGREYEDCDEEVARQLTEVAVRVEGVRPHAVQLGKILLATVDSATRPCIFAAAAFLVGEFVEKGDDVQESVAALLNPKRVCALPATQQPTPLWAAYKLYCGAPSDAVRELLVTQLPHFAQSTVPEVFERAALAQLLAAGPAPARFLVAAEKPLAPLRAAALAEVQAAAPDLSVPFFSLPQAAEEAKDTAAERILFTSAKEDVAQSGGAPTAHQSSPFHLGKATATDAAAAPGQAEEAAAEVDPLAEFQKKLLAGGTKVKYDVKRLEDPPAAAASDASSVSLPERADTSALEKKHWVQLAGAEPLRVYACVRTRNVKNEVRVDLRVENAGTAALTGVAAALGESRAALAESLEAGGRASGKVLLPVELGAFPAAGPAVTLSFTEGEEARSVQLTVPVPVTAGFSKVDLSDDQISQYCAQYGELVKEQAGRTLTLPSGTDADSVLADACALANFRGRRSAQQKKYLLVSAVDLAARPIPLCIVRVAVAEAEAGQTWQVAVRSGTQETSERVASCLEALLKGSA